MTNRKVLASVFFVLIMLFGICSAKRPLFILEAHVSAYAHEARAGAGDALVGDNGAVTHRGGGGEGVRFIPQANIQMVVEDNKILSTDDQRTYAFIYGTLKRDFPNYHYFKEDIDNNEATFLGTATTQIPFPLITGPYGTPYMLYLPDNGQQVKGELYSVSAKALAHLDELEETSVCHYERHTIKVILDKSLDQDIGDQNRLLNVYDAGSYFAYKCFGEKMWERYGKKGLSEFSKPLAEEYARQLQCRPKNHYFLADVGLYLSGEPTTC